MLAIGEGDGLAIVETAKYYPCRSDIRSVNDAVLRLAARDDGRRDAIARIVIHRVQAAMALVCEPIDQKRSPLSRDEVIARHRSIVAAWLFSCNGHRRCSLDRLCPAPGAQGLAATRDGSVSADCAEGQKDIGMSRIVDNPANLIAALDRGESLPAHWYTDPAITDKEIHRIFRKSWNYIGPLSELAEPGDYVTGQAGEIPVVVVRNDKGLAGFVNVCRHRRHLVMKGRGNATVMQCKYHAWAYDLEGVLKGVPRSAAEPGFRLENYPLLPVRVEALGPFVFVNLDRDAPALAACFGGVLDIVADSGIDLASLQLHSREDWEARANWKTMLENYLECYHCPVAHPGFSAAIDVLPENYDLTAYGWFLSQRGMVRPSALEGRSAARIYDVAGAVAQAQYHLLWPNLTININPGFPNLSIDVWMPNGPNRTKGFSEQYFAPGVSEEFARELIVFNREVGEEDDILTDAVQQGLLGGLPDRGRFLVNSEHLAIHFQKLVVEALSGEPIRPRPHAAGAEAVSRTVPLVADASAAPDSERNATVALEVFKTEPESEIITSFYLRRLDGKPLDPWEPGQFLPIRVRVPGEEQPALRTYTISTTPNPDHYRLSIRRGEDNALVSRFLQAHAKPGFRIEALRPRGKFVLDPLSERPVVMLSGGVGLTPMIAMAGQIVAEGERTGRFRPLTFIHGTANGRVHAFAEHVRALAARHPAMTVHVRYSRPDAADRLGVTHDGEGHVTLDVLKEVLPFGDYDFYLCGPPGFMQSLYDGLAGFGVRPERLHCESFATGAALRVELLPAPRTAPGATIEGAVTVRFAKSAIIAEWSRDKGTLLEFAEAQGLAPAFGCRSGICGTCTTRLAGGAVEYVEEPLAARGAGEVLLCCAIPSREAGQRAGGDPALVLDL
ncbi:MAG: SRPBCC family protein [Stellaceae bacterium]